MVILFRHQPRSLRSGTRETAAHASNQLSGLCVEDDKIFLFLACLFMFLALVNKETRQTILSSRVYRYLTLPAES